MGRIAIFAGLIGMLLLGGCSDDRRSSSGPPGFYGEFGIGVAG